MNTRTASQSQITVVYVPGTPSAATVIHNLDNLFAALLPLLRARNYGARVTDARPFRNGVGSTATLVWSEYDDTQSYSLTVVHAYEPNGYIPAYVVTLTTTGGDQPNREDITYHANPTDLHARIASILGGILI